VRLLRIALTLAYAVLLGAWAYLDQKQLDSYSQATYDVLHATAFELSFLGLAILVGFIVRSFCVLLALIGPLLSLGYLQVSGYISPWHDGVDPLLSPPGVSLFIWFAAMLAGGVWLGTRWCRHRPALRRRLAAIRSGPPN
jgi:hypothetical protein